MASQRVTNANGSGRTSWTGKGFSMFGFLLQDQDLFVSVDLVEQISCDVEPLRFVNCSVSPLLASYSEATIVHMCVCVRVPSVTIQHLISGAMTSQGFPVCLPGEAACFSLRCQFGCQMEQGGAVSCLCPPGLHLAADNRTCEGDASSKNTSSNPKPPGARSQLKSVSGV